MRHVMIDIETLGTHPGCAVLSIGAVIFGSAGIGEQFYVNIDLLSSVLCGCSVNEDTGKWWSQQSQESLNILRQNPIENLIPALERFNRFLDRNDLVWAKGPDFDLVILADVYQKVGIKVPWSFRNTRDVRTMLWLAKSKNIVVPTRGEEDITHFALGDAEYQARCVAAVAYELGIKL